MPKGYCKKITEADEQFIKDNFLLMPIKHIGNKLNISFGRIMRFLDKNGLEIPKEIREKRKLNGVIKKGNTPFNKGLKQSDYMCKESINKTKATRFVKGRKPHNTKQAGDIVAIKDSYNGTYYKYIKIKDNHWVLYHRYLWEKVNGSIPKDYILVFKDKNTDNVVIENLELISRSESMLRNSAHNYPHEIIPSMLMLKKLENKLKDLQND
jgi:hypothetical protein